MPHSAPAKAALTPAERNALRATTGTVNSIETFGTVDGPGIRYVLFMQGCPLRCLYCHNPEAIPGKGGRPLTAGEALDDILRYKKFIQSGGVTFSGGEPLMQSEFVEATSILLREHGIHTAIDTAGIQPLSIAAPAINAADLVLLDIKAFSESIAVALTGKSNKNAIETLNFCQETSKPVWIRHVLLRGYTLDDAELNALSSFLTPYTCVQQIELLPFHKLGEAKWQQLGRTYTLSEVEATTQEEAQHAREIFLAKGFKVQ